MAYSTTYDEQDTGYFSSLASAYSDAPNSASTPFYLAAGNFNSAKGLLTAAYGLADRDAYALGILYKGSYYFSASTSYWFFGSGYSSYVSPAITIYDSNTTAVTNNYASNLTLNINTPGQYFLSVSGSTFQSSQYEVYYTFTPEINISPSNVSLAISGNLRAGSTVVASGNFLDGNGVQIANSINGYIYSWYTTNGSEILKVGDSPLYTIRSADQGKYLSFFISYIDDAGYYESVLSSLSFVPAVSNSGPTGNVTISGTPTQGQTLTAANSLADADGLGAITYTWKASGTTVGTGTTYTLKQAEVGKTITVTASYTDGGSTAESVTSSATSAVGNVNDAPVLTAAGPALTPITEDDTANAGQTVASMLGNSLSDVDAGALQGIALRGVTGSSGRWQYSTSAGSTWADVGTVLETSALLLPSTNFLRWLPDGTNGTTATLVYHGWDQTSGSAGSKISVATRGGTTGYSHTTDSASLNVQSVNDAPAFSTGDGKLTTDIGAGSDLGLSVTLQPDGKILVAGYSSNGSNSDFALVRYNANGSVDTTFDGDGKLTTAIGTRDDIGYSVALQRDGKIVVAGTSFNGSNYNSDFALVRYNSNGSLDTTFDGDGKLTTAIGTSDDIGFSVALQPDGKIVVAGTSSFNFALVRYNADGSLDTTFDGDGKATTDIGANDAGVSIILQPDGKILVAGHSYSGSDNDFALVRYNADGSLDTTLDGDGKLTTAIGSSFDAGYSVALQPDGKILVAGHSYNGSNYDFALVRYNSNGSLDTTFDGDGRLTTAIGASTDSGLSVTLQPDGKILVAGYSSNGSNNDFALVRYNGDGSLDTAFDGDGKLTTDVSEYESGRSIILQPDGKILVAGAIWNGSNDDFALVRYNANGSLDTSFDGNYPALRNTSFFVEDGIATLLLNTAIRITDLELDAQGHYAGASLTLSRQGGANAQDVFSSGVAALGALTEGGALTVSGTTIGTVTQNSAGALLLSFNASATQSLVNTAIQGIAYRNTSHAPPASLELNWVFSDGNTGAQGSGGALAATGSTTVTITGVNDAPTGSLTITGTPTQGRVLTAANSLADLDGIPTSGTGAIAYQWRADGEPISGATGSTFTLTQAQVGKAISVTASYTDGGGTAESVTSEATVALANLDDPATGLVQIIGTPALGSLLSSSLSNLLDADGPITSTTWQWQRSISTGQGPLVWSDIASATAPSLAIPSGADYLGSTLRLAATTVDSLGGSTTLFSSPTDPIAGVSTQFSTRFWADAKPIANAVVQVGNATAQATGADGSVALSGIAGPSMTLSAQKPVTAADAPSHAQAVTLQDAVAILKMIAGQPANADGTPTSRLQSLAADFDGSGFVSLADALGVLRHAVGLQTPKPSWVFVEEGDDALPSILSPGIPGPVTIEVTPPGPIEVNLIGVLRGDVDGSYGVYGG
jgi:uncharacterized delta-60 repeat protein